MESPNYRKNLKFFKNVDKLIGFAKTEKDSKVISRVEKILGTLWHL